MNAWCLRKERTEYGKKIRKQYENHYIHEKRTNMTHLMPRNDGLSNTITTVLKDNYILVARYEKDKMHRKCGGGTTQSRMVFETDGISPTLCSGMEHGNTIPYIVLKQEEPENEIHMSISTDQFQT